MSNEQTTLNDCYTATQELVIAACGEFNQGLFDRLMRDVTELCSPEQIALATKELNL